MSALQQIATSIASNSDLGNPVIETGELGGSVLFTSRHPSGCVAGLVQITIQSDSRPLQLNNSSTFSTALPITLGGSPAFSWCLTSISNRLAALRRRARVAET